jgi:hypothetical protein
LELDAIVDDRIIDVMELSPEAVGETFDVVLCLGVLYTLSTRLMPLRGSPQCAVSF